MGLSWFSTICQLYQKNILQDMIGLVFTHIHFVHKLTAISKIISNQSLILRHLPPQIKEDPGFMAVLNVAFTTLATRNGRRNKVEYEVHLHKEKLSHVEHQVMLCKDKLSTPWNELSKAQQDLGEIVEILMALRMSLEANPDNDQEAMDDATGSDYEAALAARVDRLCHITATMLKGHGEDHSLLSNSSLSDEADDNHS